MTNNTVLGYRSHVFTPQIIEEFKNFVRVVNYASTLGVNLFEKSNISKLLTQHFNQSVVDETMDRFLQ